MKTLPLFRYAAIRQNDKGYWIDVDSLAPLFSTAKRKAMSIDNLLPPWADNNPVVAIKRVKIQMVEEE